MLDSQTNPPTSKSASTGKAASPSPAPPLLATRRSTRFSGRLAQITGEQEFEEEKKEMKAPPTPRKRVRRSKTERDEGEHEDKGEKKSSSPVKPGKKQRKVVVDLPVKVDNDLPRPGGQLKHLPGDRSSSLTPIPSSPDFVPSSSSAEAKSVPVVEAKPAVLGSVQEKGVKVTLSRAGGWTPYSDSALLTAVDLLSSTPLARHAPLQVLLSNPADSNYAAAAWEKINEFFIAQIAHSTAVLPREVHPDALYWRYHQLLRSAQACETASKARAAMAVRKGSVGTTVDLSPPAEKVKVEVEVLPSAVPTIEKDIKPAANGSRVGAWTADEDGHLLSHTEAGIPAAQIAAQLGRTAGAVFSRLNRLKKEKEKRLRAAARKEKAEGKKRHSVQVEGGTASPPTKPASSTSPSAYPLTSPQLGSSLAFSTAFASSSAFAPFHDPTSTAASSLILPSLPPPSTAAFTAKPVKLPSSSTFPTSLPRIEADKSILHKPYSEHSFSPPLDQQLSLAATKQQQPTPAGRAQNEQHTVAIEVPKVDAFGEIRWLSSREEKTVGKKV